MIECLLAVRWLENNLWYALPLIVAVSLVYAATRHEEMRPILRHSVRIGLWILGFMVAIFAVLLLISSQL
jgi:multisubunit Na+/H+ antiporter MnhB subunit